LYEPKLNIAAGLVDAFDDVSLYWTVFCRLVEGVPGVSAPEFLNGDWNSCFESSGATRDADGLGDVEVGVRGDIRLDNGDVTFGD
jgi:hypothetical protein